jgi:hypothetical protein
MKLAAASALILAICAGNTCAFSTAPTTASNGLSSSALRSTAATKTYTFTKSEEIFAEAKTVSFVLGDNDMCAAVVLYVVKGESNLGLYWTDGFVETRQE